MLKLHKTKAHPSFVGCAFVLGEIDEFKVKFTHLFWRKFLKLERAYKEESSGSICPLMYQHSLSFFATNAKCSLVTGFVAKYSTPNL